MRVSIVTGIMKKVAALMVVLGVVLSGYDLAIEQQRYSVPDNYSCTAP